VVWLIRDGLLFSDAGIPGLARSAGSIACARVRVGYRGMNTSLVTFEDTRLALVEMKHKLCKTVK